MAYMRDSNGRRLDSFAVAEYDPDDIGYDIFLVAGQSNALGRGIGMDATYIDVAGSRVKQFPSLSSPLADMPVAALDPLWHQETPVRTAGFALTFAKLYADTIPLNRSVLLVPTARGNTGFFASGQPYTWKVGETGSGVNLNTLAAAQLAKAAALPNSRVKGILFHQGEANGATDPLVYRGYLEEFIDYYRGIYGADLPFIMGQISPAKIATDSGYAAVDVIHRATPSRKPYVGFWEAAAAYNSSGDNIHYSAQGQRANGRQAFAAWLLAQDAAGGIVPAPTVTNPVVAYDNFTRANGPLGTAPSGQAWGTFGLGDSAVASISGNALLTPTSGTPRVEVIDAGYTDVTFKARLVTAGTRQTGLAIRASSSGDYIRLATRVSAGNFAYILQEVVGATGTTIATSTITSADNDIIEVACHRSALAITINGVQAFSHITTGLISTFGTYFGFWYGALSSGMVWDDVEITRTVIAD